MFKEIQMNEKLQGWINLFKPKGISSFSAIYKIKKKFIEFKRIRKLRNSRCNLC